MWSEFVISLYWYFIKPNQYSQFVQLLEFSKATLKTNVVINWLELDFCFSTVCFCIHSSQESPFTCLQGSWHLNTSWPAGSEGRSTESKPSDSDARNVHLTLPHVRRRMSGWIKLLHVRPPVVRTSSMLYFYMDIVIVSS